MFLRKLQWHKENRFLDLANGRLKSEKRFLTTYLTITGFGVHGDSGDESSKEQLFWNKRCQKGAEIVRKKFH